jgi:hypothetical protein
MKGFVKGHAKLLLLACAALSSLAVAATAQAADSSSFCVGGHTETYASDSWAAGDLGFYASETGGYYVVQSADDETDVLAESYEVQAEDGELAFGEGVPDGAVFVSVAQGACGGTGPGARPHNHSGLCYTKFSDDLAYFDSGDVAELLERGYWTPSAVITASGVRLICNRGADMVATGTMIGSDGKTIVTDAFAGSNLGWTEIYEARTA